MASIRDNINNVRARIRAAAERTGRNPEDILLVAATKDTSAEMMKEAIAAGITDIGENRVQEAASKFDALKELKINWHMIGHLQTNKVKQALGMFNVLQSVDSERLAKEISSKAQGVVPVFIEVNTSKEMSKFGIDQKDAADLARVISSLPNLKLTGLMTIGPLTEDKNAVRNAFRALSKLFGEIKGLNLNGVELKYLSMGMSDDYELAIEEGSNLVRVGRAIFGVSHPSTSR